MKPVAFTSGQFGGRFTYIQNNPAAVLPNGMALYSEPSEQLLEVVELLRKVTDLAEMSIESDEDDDIKQADLALVRHARSVLEKLK